MKTTNQFQGISSSNRTDFSPVMQWVKLNHLAEAQEAPQEFWQDLESLKQSNHPGELEVARMKNLMQRYGLLN